MLRWSLRLREPNSVAFVPTLVLGLGIEGLPSSGRQAHMDATAVLRVDGAADQAVFLKWAKTH